MVKKQEAPTESELLMEALISQGCSVEAAERIVRAGEVRRTRRMSWGVDKGDIPTTRH
ncbi:hypothetical protein [Sphingomonas colocasiae]|uniref:Uncharacterized protein n=1 Tax=Sphingomonas colocasiae TaxID=1848973 RepID=A0ABS7PIB0_9SPHN|nr:hypothetical protein [Sphingomonas colocasiae]MBY8820983.1 hypothetical protein [Sphingomonas colocasiae]